MGRPCCFTVRISHSNLWNLKVCSLPENTSGCCFFTLDPGTSGLYWKSFIWSLPSTYSTYFTSLIVHNLSSLSCNFWMQACNNTPVFKFSFKSSGFKQVHVTTLQDSRSLGLELCTLVLRVQLTLHKLAVPDHAHLSCFQAAGYLNIRMELNWNC